MTFLPARSRRLIAAAGVALAAVLFAGCAGAAEPAASETAPAGDWTPVTTTGAFGSAEIEAQPEHVLALSPTDADILLSLGVTPIAIPSSAQTDAATGGTGMFPWQKDLYPEGTPKLIVEAEDVNVEAIAATHPDLIVSTTFFGLDESVYQKLSAIAPVVHFDTGANEDPWEDSTRKIAEAVGKSDAADDAIATAEDTLSTAAEENPTLKGKSYSAVISPTSEYAAILCSNDDNLARVMAALGMTLNEYSASIDCPGGKARISWEDITKLDADMVWAIPDNDAEADALKTNDTWNSIPAVKNGHVVVVPKTTGVPFALSFPSPLSIEWATDQLVPQFAAAVEG